MENIVSEIGEIILEGIGGMAVLGLFIKALEVVTAF